MIQIIMPQFDRTDGKEINEGRNIDFSSLHKCNEHNLKQMGLQMWNDDGDETLWLYPAEWYDSIPNGTPIVSINGDKEIFEKGVTDNDKRFGALAFGFVKPKESAKHISTGEEL